MLQDPTNNNLIKDEIRSRLTDYIRTISEPSPKGGKDMYICPCCGSGNGKNRTGGFHITGEKWHCFSCDQGGDIFTLYGLKNKLDPDRDFPLIIEGLSDALGISRTEPIRNRTAETKAPERDPDRVRQVGKYADQMTGSPAEEYLHQRGINDETIKHFNLGYNPETQRVVIPYPNENYKTERRLRADQDKKYLYPNGETVPLFVINEDRSRTFFITEGQIDALSMYQSGARNIIALGGGSTKLLKDINISGGIIIADRDTEIGNDGLTAGQRTAKRIQDDLSERQICSVVVYPSEPYKDSNDILKDDQDKLTELLKQGLDQFEQERERLSQEYREQYSAKSYIDQFLRNIENEKRNGSNIPTGYKELDHLLDGGLYSGLYALGGGTGTGKTTFTLNLAENIARQGLNVLLIELEMSREELFAKIISRISLRVCQSLSLASDKALTTRDILRGGKPNESKEDRLVREESIKDFAENVAPYLFIYESIGDCTIEVIREEIEKNQRNTGTKPVVLIDYLQIMSHQDQYLRWNDKAKTDSNILGLKQISRDYMLPVLIVSSLNRESYKDISQEITLTSFKESGAIEYSCDVVIALQLSAVTDLTMTEDRGERTKAQARIKDENRSVPKKLDIKVLKNRHGEFGGVIRFEFDQRYNLFSEIMRVRKSPEQIKAEKKRALTSFADDNER